MFTHKVNVNGGGGVVVPAVCGGWRMQRPAAAAECCLAHIYKTVLIPDCIFSLSVAADEKGATTPTVVRSIFV